MLSRAATSSMTLSLALRTPTAREEFKASSDRLQGIITDERRKKVERGKKILTGAAKDVIRCFLQSTEQAASSSGNPHEMLPSADENDYSYWCSFCCDRNTDILLCAGCRIGTCVQDPDHLHMGCLEPAPEFRMADFVFYCFLCCRDKGKPFNFARATTSRSVTKDNLSFRYDPAVMFVVLSLPNSSSNVAGGILLTLRDWYKGNTKAVAEFQLKLGRVPKTPRRNKEVASFLNENPLAKIVIVVETHSGQDGKLITDDTGKWIYSDDLGPILQTYLPSELATVLDSKSPVEHSHRTLILNISCGASVIDERARKSLLAGHCGELVISFGVNAVIPARISGPLGEFVHQWVGTMAPLTDIIHRTMTPAYVSNNAPVFSSREFDHFTVVVSDPLTVAGHLVRCINGCNTTLGVSSKALGYTRRRYKIQCPGCRFLAVYFSPDVEQQVSKEERSKVKKIGSLGYWAPYPVQTLPLEWRQKKSADSSVQPTQGQCNKSLPRPVDPRSGGTNLPVGGPTISRAHSEDGLSTLPNKRSRAGSDRGGSELVQRKRSRNKQPDLNPV